MKRAGMGTRIVGLCIGAVIASAAMAGAQTSREAGYPLTMHVTESHAGTRCTTIIFHDLVCHHIQTITATVEGKKLELETEHKGVLAAGDYPAQVHPSLLQEFKLSKDSANQNYRILLPDGKTRDFTVVKVLETGK